MNTTIPDNREIYDKNWPDWVDMKIHGPASRWLRALIGDALNEAETKAFTFDSVLDVGCGEGTVTHALACRLSGARVLGVDFSEAGIACAQAHYKRENLEFRCESDSSSLGEGHDLVTAFEVLEHVEDWQELLGRMADSTRKALLLSFPTGRMRPFEKIVGHLRNFQLGEVETFLAARHFVPAQIFYAGFPFYSPCYRELCNVTAAAGNHFTRGSYGVRQRLVAEVLFRAFRHFSTRNRRGDQFCGLFMRAV